jgi:hypothetical protein
MKKFKQLGLSHLVTIAAILFGLTLPLGLSAWSSNQTAVGANCETNLEVLESKFQEWLMACSAGDSELSKMLSNQTNLVITQWNAGQCTQYGVLTSHPSMCPHSDNSL